MIKGNKRLVKKLLKKGVEVNALDKADKTALDYAAEHNHSGIVLKLVKKKASGYCRRKFKHSKVYYFKASAITFRIKFRFSNWCYDNLYSNYYYWSTKARLRHGGATVFSGFSLLGSSAYWNRQVHKVQIIK